MRLLFICSENKVRSPAAEALFIGHPLHEAKSAGLSKFSRTIVTPEAVKWADKIFVMQEFHKTILEDIVGKHNKEVINLNIPNFLFARELNWTLKEKLKDLL